MVATDSLVSFWRSVGPHRFQFCLALSLAMGCGALFTLVTFPMPYIADGSHCVTRVPTVDVDTTLSCQPSCSTDQVAYSALSWERTDLTCDEPPRVFITRGGFVRTTVYLVAFGLTKAAMNFCCGVICDRLGRRWAMALGWTLGLPLPWLVLKGPTWAVVASSNVFLGLQQALSWSASIFIMNDLAGRRHAGLAIGLNETGGYLTLAVFGEVAAAILRPDDPRGACYYVAFGLLLVGLSVSIGILKESKDTVRKEAVAAAAAVAAGGVVSNADGRTTGGDFTARASLHWPGGRSEPVPLWRAAFLYTSFISPSLMVVCAAGLMVNLVTGLTLGPLSRWLKAGEVGVWEGVPPAQVAHVLLAYGLPKGLLQSVFGFWGDAGAGQVTRRRPFIASGLLLCSVGLVVVAGVGSVATHPVMGVGVGAFLLGLGTAMMYSNNLAAVSDHADPTYRATALGTYRFWRDLGYVVGGLLGSMVSDALGVPAAVFTAAVLLGAVGLLVLLLYREAEGPPIVCTTEGGPLLHLPGPLATGSSQCEIPVTVDLECTAQPACPRSEQDVGL